MNAVMQPPQGQVSSAAAVPSNTPSAATPSRTVEYAPAAAPAVPWRERINLRLVVLLGIPLLAFGWVTYVIVDQVRTGGIKDYGSYFQVDLKSLGSFTFDELRGTLDDVPPQYRALDGKRVLLEGEMYNPYGGAKVNEFQLVYSIQKCCFGGPPKVQERVFARTPNHRDGVTYHSIPVRVLGTLHVKLERQDNGKIGSVFTLDVEELNPA
jgi:hypothetical protein